jgi:hypothetical protein
LARQWRLFLDESCWRLQVGRLEHTVAVSDDAALALARIPLPGDVPRRGDLEVEIGDGHLRYLVIDWPTGLSGRAERRAWAAERFRIVHDIEEEGWVISVDDNGGASALGCAAPLTLVDAVKRFAHEHRLRIVAFTGSFMLAYNRLPAQATTGPGAFALRCGSRLTLGVWNQDRWRRVLGFSAGADAAASLSRALSTSLAALALETSAGHTALLHVNGIDPGLLPAGWQLAPARAVT